MGDDKPRVRFAPSPTGQLHVGNARTALFNWLFARHHDGILILRIEDTDQTRSEAAYEQALLDELRWLGLDWDEGPDREGPCGPYRQSERSDLYREYLEKLKSSGKAYPCYCTDEELEAERASLLVRKMMPRYMGKCRSLTAGDRERREAEGRKPAWRFAMGRGFITFRDLIRGAVRFDAENMGDFIIVRSNGIPAYNFAVVIDDHHMRVTLVIRGEDHISNTALQLRLYEALGFSFPAFAHHALILARDRSKLSKRHGAVTVEEFRTQGILPEALVNYLALLGSSTGTDAEVLSREELIRAFSLERAGKSGAIFDEDKLRWLNGIYIRQERPERLTERAIPFLSEAGYRIDQIDRSWLQQAVEAVRDNLVTLTDAPEALAVFFDDRYLVDDDAARILGESDTLAVLETLLDVLKQQAADEPELYRKVIGVMAEKTGFQGKKLFMPIRVALTGRTRGPELIKIFDILGRDALIRRLEKSGQRGS